MRQPVVVLAVLVVVVGVVFSYVLLCKKDVIDSHGNGRRHLTDEFNYAHFSKITAKNYWFNPQLLAAHPVRFTLTAGDAIIIPPGWWHWVTSEPSTFAVNFWATKTAADLQPPRHKLHAVVDHVKIMSVIESYTGPVRVWNSARDVFLGPEAADFKSKRIRPNEYIITVKGPYEITGTVSPNEELLSAVLPHVQPPREFARAAEGPVDTNVWISFGKHDTGLHRDDFAGMLVVLKGRKRVTLYPPQDTPLLKPYSLVPQWAESAWPCAFSPNLYTLSAFLTREQASSSLPSARLLYESMAAQAKNKAALLHFIKLLYMVTDSPLVWGCKRMAESGVMRWEVYAYHFNYVNTGRRNTDKVIDLLLDQHPYARAEAGLPEALLHSFDVADAPTIPEILNGNVHVYKTLPGCGAGPITLPVFGEGTTVSPAGDVTRESSYVIGTRAQFTDHYMHFMTGVGFEESTATAFQAVVLERYPGSPVLCVHNKFDGNVFVQYLGVSTAEFLQFLQAFAYPRSLCTHVAEHADKYAAVPHEITIVFHGETHIPIRTAFYGTLTPLHRPKI